MSDWLSEFHAAVLTYRPFAGPIFGLMVLAESLVLLGVFVPATPLLFLVGTLIGSGQLDGAVILPFALVGAAAGYWISWSLGVRSGKRVYRSRRFRPHRREVARARLFFRRWGGPSLVLGRYVLGPFQSMLPFVAGVATMPASKFHIWNGLSSVIWVVVVLTPGYLVGRGVVLPFFGQETQSMLAAGLLALSLCLALGAVFTVGRRVIARL